MKPQELIEVREQALADIQNRLTMVLSDHLDSDEKFQHRSDQYSDRVGIIDAEIAKLRQQREIQVKLQTQMDENREGGHDLIIKLKSQVLKLESQVSAVRIFLAEQELNGLVPDA